MSRNRVVACCPLEYMHGAGICDFSPSTRALFLSQSRRPVAAGRPSHEIGGAGRHNRSGLPAAPSAGDKPQPYISSFYYQPEILGAASLGCREVS